MSKDKCKLNPKQREKALNDCGFTMARDAEGSHTMYEHAALKQLARTRKIEAPPNIGAGNTRSPWQMTVPGDPANGTWNSIMKQAKWCQQTVEQLTAASAHDQQRLEVARQFRKAAGEYRAWKKTAGHLVRDGKDLADVPAPPITFKDLMQLQLKATPHRM